jgi:hypothetical protein
LLSAADLLKLVLSIPQQFRHDPLFGFAPGTGKHVPVLSYAHAKTFDIVREAGDSLSLLCKLQGSCREVLPEGDVSTSFCFFEEPTSLAS